MLLSSLSLGEKLTDASNGEGDAEPAAKLVHTPEVESGDDQVEDDKNYRCGGGWEVLPEVKIANVRLEDCHHRNSA